jgi:photosystem II stability/assembly factor-like uncharacterized protein
MLAAALSLFGAVALPTVVQAASDTSFAIESPKAAKGLMIDVVHAGKRLVAVGDRGHILYSDDQGSTWTQAKVPTRQLLTAVFFIDDKQGWAVGHDAQILSSSDGGAGLGVTLRLTTVQLPLRVWLVAVSTPPL